MLFQPRQIAKKNLLFEHLTPNDIFALNVIFLMNQISFSQISFIMIFFLFSRFKYTGQDHVGA